MQIRYSKENAPENRKMLHKRLKYAIRSGGKDYQCPYLFTSCCTIIDRSACILDFPTIQEADVLAVCCHHGYEALHQLWDSFHSPMISQARCRHPVILVV